MNEHAASPIDSEKRCFYCDCAPGWVPRCGVDRVIEPMELAHLLYKMGTNDEPMGFEAV